MTECRTPGCRIHASPQAWLAGYEQPRRLQDKNYPHFLVNLVFLKVKILKILNDQAFKLDTLLKRAMAIIREEIVINFHPCPKTNVRCPVAACSFFAEHPYDSNLGNLNRATDFALRTVKMHVIKHRVLGDLDAGAGPGHDLGEEETFGQPTMPRDTAQPAQQQINAGPQNPKASPVQSMTMKKQKNILLNIENQLLKRSRLRDEETDKLRNKGRSLRFLYKSKR